ncbi:hypothetical protein L204_102320 [Cryptococcus depauperatus]|nr:hypothetical protein L204_05973 [Cryptococcus depauperatus CBS 7855]
MQFDVSGGIEPVKIFAEEIKGFEYIGDSQLSDGRRLSSVEDSAPDGGQATFDTVETDENGGSMGEDGEYACSCTSTNGESLCTAGKGDMCDCVGQFGNFYSESGATENPQQLLNLDALPENLPLVECSPACTCYDQCAKKVTQGGVCVPLSVRRAASGLGLFYTPQEPLVLPKGTFISLYAGEYLTQSEAHSRWSAISVKEKEKGRGNYTLSLRTPGETIHIDPRWKGNVGRFLNHSCEPNCVLHYVRWGIGRGWARVAIFTNRDIRPEEELTFDYANASGQRQLTDQLLEKSATSTERTRCLCGTNRCRGWMPFDESL